MVESHYICGICNETEFGKDWVKKWGRVITRFAVPFNEEMSYAVARHDYDKHGIKHGTPDKDGEEFFKKVLSDKYKNTDLGNIID